MPAALTDGAAGDWFGELVRMNDGAAHASLKPWLSARLATLRTDAAAISRLREASQAACADAYLACGDWPPARLDDFVFRQPIYALAAWLGVAPAQWADVYDDVHTLVAAMAEAGSPSPRKEVLARGHRAAATLRHRIDDWLDNGAAPGTWLRETARRAARGEGPDDDALALPVVVARYERRRVRASRKSASAPVPAGPWGPAGTVGLTRSGWGGARCRSCRWRCPSP